jgi:lipopolysaccharide export system permease protein
MRIGGIVERYVFREMIPPFFLNLALFTFVFLMAKILDITDLIINYGVSVSSVMRMLIYFVPSFLVFVLPMSIMMGVLLAFLRLSHDHEVVALKAAGFSLYRLLPPVFVFCLVGCLLTGLMTLYGSPRGRVAFKDLLYETAMSNVEMGLKERTFNDSFKGMMLYVNQIDPKDKRLTDVFIEDRQTPGMVSTVIAPTGKLFSDPKKFRFRLTLYNGIANRVDLQNKMVHALSFDTYDVDLDLHQVFSAGKFGRKAKKEKEMTLGELRQALREARNDSTYSTILMEYHRKFSIPFACFVLGLIAVPLGIQSLFAKRSFGMVLGLFCFLIYYILISAGWICGESGIFPPAVGMWGPNVLLGLLGIYLLIGTARERPIGVIFFLPRMLMWLKSS